MLQFDVLVGSINKSQTTAQTTAGWLETFYSVQKRLMDVVCRQIKCKKL